MSKIKYPDQKVVQNEIDHILDQSGVFEESEITMDSYHSFRPVNSKKIIIKTVLSLGSAAAVLFVLFFGLKTGISFQPKTIKPLSVITEDNANNDNYDFVNDDIDVQIVKSSNGTGKNTFFVPKVYYQNQEVDEIQEFYENNISLIENSSFTTYRNFIKFDNKYSELNGSDVFNISSKCVVEPGISKIKTSTLAIVENREIGYQYNDAICNSNNRYAYNFDMDSAKVITINDLFKDYNSGIQEVCDYLNPILRETYEKEYADSIIVSESSALDIFKDGNWYFSQDGIVVFFNYLYKKQIKEKDTTVTSYNYETFIIPYEELPQLKDRYRVY